MARFEVRKINGKLCITDDGKPVYHMPFWVRVNGRKDLNELADAFNQKEEPHILDIMDFETKYSTKKR